MSIQGRSRASARTAGIRSVAYGAPTLGPACDLALPPLLSHGRPPAGRRRWGSRPRRRRRNRTNAAIDSDDSPAALLTSDVPVPDPTVRPRADPIRRTPTAAAANVPPLTPDILRAAAIFRCSVRRDSAVIAARPSWVRFPGRGSSAPLNGSRGPAPGYAMSRTHVKPEMGDRDHGN